MSWSRRWLDGLDLSEQRVEQGRYLARRGHLHDLEIAPGHVDAQVREGRLRPFRVHVDVETFDDDTWERVLPALAGEVRATAALLEGELPDHVAELFAGVGASLVPSDPAGTCTCGERQPCKHVAAVHQALADRFDDDPFLLLELRGRDRDSLLASLRSLRAGEDGVVVPGTVALGELATRPFDVADGDLDAIPIHPHPVDDPAALLDHLGPPPGLDDTAVVDDLLARAAAFAWRIAAGEGADVADEALLLAELRSQRMATAEAVADALGWDRERTREELDRLFVEGRAMRTGQGERTRYRAAPGA